MKFSDIPGHEEVKSRLRQMVDAGRIPHALLLQGPSGIGKMAVARAFAQYIHCTDRHDGEPCGVCASCLQHQSFNHIDTYYVFPIVKRKSGSSAICDDFLPEWREYLTDSPWMDYDKWLVALDKPNAQPVIYVDESASLLRKLQYTARTSLFKIVIVWLPEKMNTECANKLLKMVEEPFEDTLLVFVSNTPREILPTIYSRLQRIDMRRHSDELTAKWLEQTFGTDAADAMAVAHVAEGSLVAAERQLKVNADSKKFLDLFMQLMRLAYQRKVKELREWSEAVAGIGREKECRFLDYCIRMLRENFIYNIRVPGLNYLNRDEASFSANFARFINERNVEKLIAVLDKARIDIAGNGNAKIIMFDVAVKVILLLKT